MKIAIIGAGQVGKAQGVGWSKAGHQIIYGFRLLEPLAMLWVHLAVFKGQGWGFAFSLLRKNA
jgi:hypothetical protein